MDRRVLLFVGFQDPKAGNAERESPRGTFRRSVPSGSCDVEAAFSRLYPGSIGAIGEIRIAALVVKYLDRSKTNNCESISQECFH
jgi:hypothetical protein